MEHAKPNGLARRVPLLRRLCPLLFLALALAGCSHAVVAENPVTIPAADYSHAYEAAQEVLRDYGFVLDRRDYRFGVVTTRPRLAPTIFEPHYTGNTTLEQSIESTLNLQQRIVRITLEPQPTEARTRTVQPADERALRQLDTIAPDPDLYNLRVEVMIERKQRPELQLTGATHGFGVFGAYGEVPRELALRGVTEDYWLPLRRDLYLEQRIMSEILNRTRIATDSPDAPATDDDAPR